jgi:hypothetical protein
VLYQASQVIRAEATAETEAAAVEAVEAEAAAAAAEAEALAGVEWPEQEWQPPCIKLCLKLRHNYNIKTVN